MDQGQLKQRGADRSDQFVFGLLSSVSDEQNFVDTRL